MYIKSDNIKFILDDPSLIIGNNEIKLNKAGIARPNRIYLKITNSCNLNCKYCFQKDDLYISESIDLNEYATVIKKYISEPNTEIVIFGGEPLLDRNIKNLNYLFDIAQNNKSYFIFTNGFFSESIKKLLVDNQNSINLLNISIDGPEEIHNMRRPAYSGNSYKKIINNSKALLANKIPFIFSINIDKENVEYVEQGLNELENNLGLNNINIIFNKILHTDQTISELEFLEMFLSIASKYSEANMSINSVVYTKLLNILSGNGFSTPRCNIENTLVLDFCSKKVYICPESIDTEIGELYSDVIKFNLKNKKSYTDISNKKIIQCIKCEYANYCKYGCIKDKDVNYTICKNETKEELQFIINNFNRFFYIDD